MTRNLALIPLALLLRLAIGIMIFDVRPEDLLKGLTLRGLAAESFYEVV